MDRIKQRLQDLRTEADNATARAQAADFKIKHLEQTIATLEEEKANFQRNPDAIRDYYKTRADKAEEKIRDLEDRLREVKMENKELKEKLEDYESSG